MSETTERPGYEPELTEPPTPAPTARYSSMQRLWMMFTSPGQVFEDIGIKPTWVLIMAILVILGVAAQLVIAPHIDSIHQVAPASRYAAGECSVHWPSTMMSAPGFGPASMSARSWLISARWA